MCGIVGYIGRAKAVDVLVPALKRLEYRGYDSAGLATVNGHGLEAYKAAGKIANLEALFTGGNRPNGTLGIAHTRWATHGRPSEANSHPRVDCHGKLTDERAALEARARKYTSPLGAGDVGLLDDQLLSNAAGYWR